MSATYAERATTRPGTSARDAAPPEPSPGDERVAICIPTCKRPGNLRQLLTSLRDLDLLGIDLRLIVVDNDVERSARPVIAEAMATSGIPVTYDCVAEQSLPLARNRLVELAIDQRADWIWFLDDDQVTRPDALRLMLSTARAHGADGVIPRVPQTFETGDRPWAQWSGIFDEMHRPTGKRSHNFGTNGILLRRTSVQQVPHPFDDRLRLTGGEDSLFFARFGARGCPIVGCDEAVVYDRVHASRNNPGWLTRRALRIGLVKGFVVREIEPSPAKSLKWIALGGGYAAANLFLAMLALPLGPSKYFRYWIRAVRGYGIVAGILRPRLLLHRSEYRVIHGA